MNRLIAEFIGTFALVFTGTGAIVTNDTVGGVTHVGIALTFGLVVMALIYAVGNVSGVHLNPAVTLGFLLAGRFERGRVLPYIAAQLIGAGLASALMRLLFTHPTLGATLPSGPWWRSFVLETVLTFLLMFTVLCVATGAKEQGIMAGAAIGAVVALEALFAGPACGASMNPARSMAPAIVSGRLEHLWIYVAAPIVGVVFAVPAWRGLESQ